MREALFSSVAQHDSSTQTPGLALAGTRVLELAHFLYNYHNY